MTQPEPLYLPNAEDRTTPIGTTRIIGGHTYAFAVNNDHPEGAWFLEEVPNLGADYLERVTQPIELDAEGEATVLALLGHGESLEPSPEPREESAPDPEPLERNPEPLEDPSHPSSPGLRVVDDNYDEFAADVPTVDEGDSPTFNPPPPPEVMSFPDEPPTPELAVEPPPVVDVPPPRSTCESVWRKPSEPVEAPPTDEDVPVAEPEVAHTQEPDGVVDPPRSKDDPIFYTVSRVAEMFAVTEATVRNWLKKGDLRGFKLGLEWRVSREDVIRFANERYPDQ